MFSCIHCCCISLACLLQWRLSASASDAWFAGPSEKELIILLAILRELRASRMQAASQGDLYTSSSRDMSQHY